MLFSFIWTTNIFAQCEVTIEGAAVITVPSGTGFGTEGNITLQNSTGAFDNSGVVHLSGNWTNNAVSGGLVNGSAGTVVLEGANQNIAGSAVTTFRNLTLAGTGIKTITAASATVTHVLNLADRELATGPNFLNISTTGSITYTVGSGFISSTAGGYLQRQTNSTALYHYPVGKPGGGLFRPIDISPATTTSNNFRVRQVSNTPTTDGYAATSTDATICSTVNTAFYHLITQTGTDNATLTMYFSSAIDGNFSRMAHWQAPGPIWTNMNPVTTNAGAYGHTNGISRAAWTNFTTPAFALALPLTPLAPVANAATTIACNSFTANWSASTDANHLSADITKYFLDVATDAGFTAMVSGYNNLDVGNVTTISVTGLNTGTNYYYRVRAMNNCGTSGNSNVIGPVQTITASVAPTALSAAASNPMCPGFNATLTQSGGSLGTGTSWKWYSDNTYTTLVGTGIGANASLVVTPMITTTYYLRIEGGTFPCTANLTGPVGGVTVTVQVIPSLAPLTGNQSIICGGTTVFSNFPTGGTVTTSGGYRIHTFTSSGTFSVPSSFPGTVDVLVVGGGGGGGADMGGGGGGGGVIYNTGFSVTPGTNITVTVGAGGSGAPNGNNVVRGTNGSPSIFSSITALGGGGGASRHDATNNPAGTGSGIVSSGGGASGAGTISGYGGAAGVGTAGQGNNGGGSIGTWYPGGGGGAGGAGGTNPANGGAGVSNSILGTAYYWGAGGGGAGYSNIAGNGGLGGGGGGAPKVSGGGLAGTGGLNPGEDGSVGVLGQQTNVPGGNGAPNTGAGGGGGSHYNNGNHGGAGGSGIVIVRYPDVTNGNWSSSNPGVATVNSAGVVTGVSPGTATITYQLVVGGCNSTAVVTRDVTVALPTLSPITGTTTICAGSTSALTSSPKATGGIESVVGGYRIHTFLSSGTLNVTRSGNMEVLVVAGGGGGGTNMGGGGGGGGVIANPSFPVSAGSISVTVGNGGAGAPAGTCSTSPCHPTVAGSNGQNSVFSTLTAIGGGRGGYSYNSIGTTTGVAGGSGGGASGYNDNGAAMGAITGGAGTPAQGFGGGYQGNAYYSGGGGGAGGVGSSGNSQAHGGPGVENSILGTSYYWGGGGGGAAYSLGTGGNGGIGGGGGGAVGVTTGGVGYNNGSPGGGGCSGCWANTPGGNGGANTGGGGGGGAHYYSGNKGGDGGSGIVVVKYLDGANGTWSSTNTGVATVDAATGVVTGVAAGSTTIKYTVTIGSCVAEQTTLFTVTDAPAPTSVTATPSAICTGGSSNLNATSSGNNINWYTQASGGISIGTSASGANFAVTPASTTTYYAETATILTGSQTFNYSGSFQTFTVPPLVTSITIDAYGAQGNSPSCAGGLGGRAQGTLTVTPGQVLTIYVGGQTGFNGGGRGGCRNNCGGSGGGASDIRVGGTGLANRVIVAGGGGGGGGPATSWNCGVGGVGGGTTGGNGTGSSSNLGIGTGGTQSAGGGTSNGGCGAGIGGSGTLGQGGTGVDFSSWSGGGAGGGGGGYYGGGAGSYCGDGGGGGGGSSYTGGVTGGTTTAGVRSGNGQIIISWNIQGCLSASRTPVTVTVNPLPNDITPTAVASSVCTGSGTNIQIASSQSGVNYQLRNNAGNINIGSPLAGTGGTINLPTGNLSVTTTFNVLATFTATGCFRQMTNTVTVTVYPYPMVGSISGSATVCEGYTTNLTIVPPTGGTITNSGGYTIHTFTSNGSFSPPTTFTGTVEVLAVAGGGGGAGSTWGGGGGGGGGVIHHAAFPVTGGTPIAVTVGGGGAAMTAGGDSYFGAMRAFGGGAACSNCGPGGSGGGTHHSNPGGGNNAVTQTSNNGGTGYGNVGGNAVYANPYWCGSGGGGGGAGSHGGAGGIGFLSSISGVATYYAGGGGQCNNNGNATGGGTGGGGTGANGNAGNGGVNTGGGGGGSRGGAAGTGGSGIVIVRYLTPPAGTWSSSNTLVATVNPTTGVVTGVSAGSATISYAVTVNGCTTTATYPITINATPAAVTVSGGGTFCSSTSISASGGSGGTIYFQGTTSGGTSTSLGGTPQTVTTSGTYYFRSYNGNCWGPEGSVSVTIQYGPPSTPISGVPTVCVNGTTTLSGPAPYGSTPPTGGTISYLNGDRIHTFTSVGTVNFTTSQAINARVLVVAGGGGGGMDMGGGGGGGGVIYNADYAIPSGNTTVTVGGGGSGAPAACTGGQPCAHQYTIPANNGGNSVFGGITTIGGGRGGSSYRAYTPGISGSNGGSGGGAGGYNDNAGTYYGGSGTAGQGYRGGNSANAYYSGGGGGAGGVGIDGNNKANGGPGVLNDILGTAYYWGGGGGGAGYSIGGGDGGIGGGGGGAVGAPAGAGGAGYNNGSAGTNGCTGCHANVPGGNAGANTGGGGGGGSHYQGNNKGGDGGSGIVVVRYPDIATGVWSTDNPSVATVSSNGVVTGVTPGTANISYTTTNTIGCPTTVTQLVTVNSPPIVSPASATPTDICIGASSNLNATSAGNIINWYTVSFGGPSIGTTASAVNLPVTPLTTTTYYAEATSVLAGTLSQTFNYTGNAQTFTVPTGITSISIDAYGAQGENNTSPGGLGGRAQGMLTVTPGQVINIYVGGQNGYNGGGAPGTGGAYPGVYGGGASDVRVGGTALANRVIVAGAGGGGGSPGLSWSTVMSAGVGGGLSGGNASVCCWTPASGGTQVGGGVTGISCNNCGNTSTNGSLGQGGRGDDPCSTYGTGSGGGGGYYGGAGGESCGNGEPGAGGSSYIGGVSGGSTTAGVQTGNGKIIISWSGVWACPTNPRIPVTVTVNPLPNDITPTAASPNVCNNTGTNIQIASSQSGVNYQLRNNAGNVNVGSPVAGTGGTINLPTGNLTATTTFNVLATNTTTTCQRQMTNTVTVTVWTNLTGGTFVYTNPTSCNVANGTVTVSGVSGGSGVFEYSINGGSTYQSSPSFSGIANGTSNTVWARNTASPYCAVNLGSFTMIGPYSPISAATATATPNNLCASNTPVLTASNMAPGNGGSNTANGAYSFNGSQYLAHSNTLGLPVGSVTTVEAWIKASASQADANYNGIVGWGPRTCCPTNPATTCLLSIKSDLRLSMATWGNDFVPGSGPSVVANVWTHVAMVINGNTVQFYINGQAAQSATLSMTPNIQTGANYITIGSTDVYGRLFNGSIDNVRIWATARTQAEIRGDMYREVPATGTVDVNTLRANYTFNIGTLNNYSGLSGPNLSVNNASQSYPNAYLYTWTGANDINDNPAQTNQEQVTVGPLQGISNFTVTAVTNPDNGCIGTASTLGTALVNDFTTTPYSVNYVAGASQAVNMAVDPAPVSGMMGKSVGIRKYFEPAAGNTAPWSACVNYGVPAVIPGVAGFGPCTVPGNLQALTYSTAAPTSLSTGVACFTGTVNFPTGMLVLMNGSSTTAPVPMAIRLTLTFKTTVGDNPIPLQYVSTGHLMIRANQNFYVHAIVEGIPLNPATYMYYGGTSTYSPQIACSTVSAGFASNTYIPFYDIYDCLIKAASPDACTAFGFDKFPVFDFTPNPVSATTPVSICWGGTPASRFNLIGNTGAIPLGTTNCGGLSQSWLDANGTAINGTWSVATNGGGSSTPAAIVANATTAPATPGTTYTYVVANGTSNICYGYATVNVSHNIPVADDVNFPMPANLTNITTHWQTGLIPDTWDPASRVSGNDNWYDNRNWTHCVPDINTNAMIYQNTNPGGANYQPIINSAGANVKAITIETDNGARLQINTVGFDMINIDQ